MNAAIESKSFSFKKAFCRKVKLFRVFPNDSTLPLASNITSYYPILWKAWASDDVSTDIFHRRNKYRQSRFALGEPPLKNMTRRCRSRRAECRSNRIRDKTHGIGTERNSVAKRLDDFVTHANSEWNDFRECHLQFAPFEIRPLFRESIFTSKGNFDPFCPNKCNMIYYRNIANSFIIIISYLY